VKATAPVPVLEEALSRSRNTLDFRVGSWRLAGGQDLMILSAARRICIAAAAWLLRWLAREVREASNIPSLF
jgi:hypothetical protein